MGIEKQSSQGGNYVGGFLQMFDWNAKSRKKLFSSKPEVPEQSIQKKICDENMQTTRLHMMDVNEHVVGSSVKGSSDHSCASSVVDEDFYGTKAPGVVARLMGLDFLPKSTSTEPYSTPLFGSYLSKNLEYHEDRIVPHSSNLQDRNEMESSYKRVTQKLEKFQTEILPPKSAKSIPITHHKLLSPIKSANFVPSKDAARIMEAAARILEPEPHVSTKTKLPPQVGSSSVPLRVHDLKEKAQKPSKLFEGSQRKSESSAAKNLKRSSMSKSGSVDATPTRVMQDLDESSTAVKSKAKSISLALQAKANVQKRGGLSLNGNSKLVDQKEMSEFSRSTSQESMVKKPSLEKGSGVLRQNNQKQNCIVDRGKPSSKGGKVRSGESSSTRPNSSSKVSRVNSRKVKDDKGEALPSSRVSVTSKKRSADGSGKNQLTRTSQTDGSGKDIQSRDIKSRQSNWDQKSGGVGSDVISFTFTSPMERSRPDSRRGNETGYQSKRSSLSFDRHKVKGGDALSTLLEQKLKELADKVEFSQQNSEAVSSSSMQVNEVGLEETSISNISQDNKLVECRLPSPVSVLEHSSSADSYSSLAFQPDAELSDSASSTMLKGQTSKNPKRWEFEFVKAMLSDIELSFNDYAVGRTQDVIKPHLFDQLGSSNQFQRLMFDCVSECLEMRWRKYVRGGYGSMAKGLDLVAREDILAQEVYKEVSSWNANIEESMIDELVDNDMSNQYGRWLDFEVEAYELGVQIQSRILNSLIDEVVAEIL